MSMLDTVVPKSEQLGYDDFIGGESKTIKITAVKKVGGEQPAIVNYENENGKPWRPNKSMRRVMIRCWGDDEKQWVGRSATIYGDPKVRFAGEEVGGIVISHLSDIRQPVTLMLTKSKANKKPFTVQPLNIEPDKPDPQLEMIKRNARDNAINGTAVLQTWFTALPPEAKLKIKPFMEEYKKIASENELKEISNV